MYQRFASVNASVSLQKHYEEIKLLYQLWIQGMQAEENNFSKKISTIKMYAVYIGYFSKTKSCPSKMRNCPTKIGFVLPNVLALSKPYFVHCTSIAMTTFDVDLDVFYITAQSI